MSIQAHLNHIGNSLNTSLMVVVLPSLLRALRTDLQPTEYVLLCNGLPLAFDF